MRRTHPPISLRPGEVRTGLVVRLDRMPLFSVKVRIRRGIEIPRSWVADILLSNTSIGGGLGAYPPELDDEVTVYGLIPGIYSARATIAEQDFTTWVFPTDGPSAPLPLHYTGTTQFAITDHDVEGIEIELPNKADRR